MQCTQNVPGLTGPQLTSVSDASNNNELLLSNGTQVLQMKLPVHMDVLKHIEIVVLSCQLSLVVGSGVNGPMVHVNGPWTSARDEIACTHGNILKLLF